MKKFRLKISVSLRGWTAFSLLRFACALKIVDASLHRD